MSRKTFKNDMTLMYMFHDALRREMEHIARIMADPDVDAQHILRTSPGWQMFKDYLHVHHGAEDDVLWPEVRAAAAGNPDELAILDAIDAEHAAIDPGLDAFDAAINDEEDGAQRLGIIAEKLVAGLGGHLKHEEDEALAVVDAHATPDLLQRFGAEHNARIGPGTPRFVPWLLDGASDEDAAMLLGRLPEPVRQAYHNEWRPAYAALDRWGGSADQQAAS
jgi:hemerythrin HHE cation binding domain-containing protein